jgi:hypothetical protein
VPINYKIEGTRLSIREFEDDYYSASGCYPRVRNEKKVANKASKSKK